MSSIAAEQLKSIVERIERLQGDREDIAEDIRQIYAEAKGAGFDGPTIRRVIRLRAMDPEARQEAEALLEMYSAAVGL